MYHSLFPEMIFTNLSLNREKCASCKFKIRMLLIILMFRIRRTSECPRHVCQLKIHSLNVVPKDSFNSSLNHLIACLLSRPLHPILAKSCCSDEYHTSQKKMYRPQHTKEQIQPVIPKAKLVTKTQDANLTRDSLWIRGQASCQNFRPQRAEDERRNWNVGTHPTKTNTEIII